MLDLKLILLQVPIYIKIIINLIIFNILNILGLEIERLNYSRVAHSEDRIEGIKAFIEKRKPVYKGK